MSQRSVIKCSLRGAICLPGDRKHDLLQCLETLVVVVSKLMRRGSLLALLHYTRLLSPDPDRPAGTVKMWQDTGWRQAMTIGLPHFRINKLEDPEMRVTYEAYKHLFPADLGRLPTGAANTLTHAADQLQTAFTNNLWMPLMPRLKRLCRAWLKHHQQHNQPDGRMKCPSVHDLVRAVELGTSDTGWAVPAVEFVTEVRRRLGLANASTKLTEAHAKRNQQQMLLFLAWLQQRMEVLGGNGIRLCPVFGVHRQHIKLDRTCLVHLLHGIGLMPQHLVSPAAGTETGQGAEYQQVTELLRSVFEPPRPTMAGKSRQWWGFLATDGVAASFGYASDKPVSKGNLRGNKTKTVAGGGSKEAAPHAQPNPDGLVVVGIDPGRCTIVHAATQVGRHTLEWTLARKRYYLEAGLSQAQAKVGRWDAAMINGAWHQMNQQGGALRTSSLRELTQHIAAYNSVADSWWASALQRKRAKLRLRTYGGRKRCLDRFYAGLERDVCAAEPTKRLAIAYGAATFSPSGSGRPATPTTAAYKAALRLRRSGAIVEKQNECRTSKQCCHCHGDVEACWQQLHLQLGLLPDTDAAEASRITAGLHVETCHGFKVPKAGIYLRGLLFCPDCSKFLNRDRSAALNIRFLFTQTQLLGLPMPQQFVARRKKKTRSNQAI